MVEIAGNKMVKVLALLSILINLLSPALAGSQTPILKVSLVKYNPYPADPGKYLRVWISVSNSGLENAENVIVKVVPEFPFSLYEDEDAERYIGLIKPYDSAILDYKLKVAPDAVSGDNYLKVAYSLDNGKSWIETKLKIVVQTKNTVISIENVTFLTLMPGQEGWLNLTIRNIGDEILRYIQIAPDFSDLPVYPISSSEKEIYQLLPGREEKVSFKVISDYDAECQIFALPISISYYDTLGNQYTKSYKIGFRIDAKPEIEIIPTSKTLNFGENLIEFKVVNKGLAKVKALMVYVNSSLITSTNPYYVGEIDSDDYEIATFQMPIKNIADKVTLNVKVSYLDCSNTQHMITKSFTYKVIYKEESYFSVIILLVIIALVVFYFYRQRYRKRKR